MIITRTDHPPANVNVIDVGISDHRMIRWTMNLSAPAPQYVTREHRMWKNFQLDAFHADLRSSALCDPSVYDAIVSESDHGAAQDRLVQLYDDTLTALLDQHAPATSSTTRLRPKTDPWFDGDCRKAKRRARQLERRHKKHNSDHSRTVWIEALQDYHKLTDAKRSSFWKSKVDEAPNARQPWKTVDSILCRDTSKSVARTSSQSAVDLADYFEKKISGVRESTEGAASPSYEGNTSGSVLLSFSPLSVNDTLRPVHQAPMKQCSLDPVPTWLLKDSIELLAPFITNVINISLSNGCVSPLLKNAYITPLVKKSGLDVNEACNYRPVSNLSVLSKILERAVSQQLQRYLSRAGLFPSNQSAYRKYHSTESLLLRVTSDLISHLDQGETALMAFLDLSAAFDTVDMEILLNRLSTSFGIQGTALKWFSSYLTNRTEYVLFNSGKSSVRKVLFGVPQGSVLGPVLFLLYTADLENIAKRHEVNAHFYADDSQTYVFSTPAASTSSENRLLTCLNEMAEWMRINRLCLNPAKSQFMRCVTARRQGQLDNSPITFCGAQITPAHCVRNLGVLMDSSLSFREHVNHVVSSGFYHLRSIKSAVKSLPFETAKSLVNCFVISRIDYCNSLLANMPRYALDRLQRVMNAAARMLCGAGKYSHVSGLIRERLHWLPVPQRIRFKLCLTMYKVIHGLAPAYLSELCERTTALVRTRSSVRGDLVTRRTKTKFGERAFVVAGPAVWNSLPRCIRDAQSVNSFKTALKTFLFTANV